MLSPNPPSKLGKGDWGGQRWPEPPVVRYTMISVTPSERIGNARYARLLKYNQLVSPDQRFHQVCPRCRGQRWYIYDKTIYTEPLCQYYRWYSRWVACRDCYWRGHWNNTLMIIAAPEQVPGECA